MTPFIAALLIAAPAAAPTPTPPHAKPVCLRTETTPAAGDARPTVHPLNREPDAQQGLAVVRTFDGCRVPVVVRGSVTK